VRETWKGIRRRLGVAQDQKHPISAKEIARSDGLREKTPDRERDVSSREGGAYGVEGSRWIRRIEIRTHPSRSREVRITDASPTKQNEASQLNRRASPLPIWKAEWSSCVHTLAFAQVLFFTDIKSSYSYAD
jgi:hypothetical protein